MQNIAIFTETSIFALRLSLFGETARLLLGNVQQVKHIPLAAEAMKRGYDRKHQPALPLAIGDLVLLEAKGLQSTRPSKKLDDKRYGPFTITEFVGTQSYRLRLPPAWKIHDVFHTSKLTPYITPKFTSQLDPIIIPDLAEALPVMQSIIAHRNLSNKTLCLVLLQNQDPEDATWVT